MAQCGVASRRKCDQMISEGLVSVNDVVETRLGIKIDESQDRVKIDGKLIQPQKDFQYIVVHKPEGYVTTTTDEKKRKTVLDLVDLSTRLYPVGRLDMDTTGLLLLTNDGELAYRLMHPKFEVDKIYEVILDKSLTIADQDKLESGIALEEGKTSLCTIEFPNNTNHKHIKMTIHQGWRRQIRRMFEVLGYRVVALTRVGFASLTLKGLPKGAWRHLTTHEVNQIKAIAGI
jgi:23S rRNA pseudouridine2605 synthase